MPCTIQDIVETERWQFPLRVDGDLSQSASWIHTTEIEDAFVSLEGGEVILTAGTWLERGADVDRFVKLLREANVAALGFGVTSAHPTTPPELRRACRSFDLILFEVPIDIPFIAITKLFAERFALERQRPLEEILHQNELFSEAVNDEHGLKGILRVLNRFVPYPCGVLGPGPRFLCAPTLTMEDSLALELWRRARDKPTQVADSRFSVFPVVRGTWLEACLIVEVEPTTLSLREKAAIHQALTYMGLEMARRRASREGERRFASELSDLLAKGTENLDAVLARLHHFGIDAHGKLVVATCQMGLGEELGERALDLAEVVCEDFGIKAMVASKGTRITIIAEWNDEARSTSDFAKDLARAMLPGTCVGVGSVATTPAGLRRSLVEAQQVCRLAGKPSHGRNFATHLDLGSHVSLLTLQDSDIAEIYCNAVLQDVRLYDQSHQVKLIETLAEFFASGQRWGYTASRLNVHVNTLRNRLSKVEELTGRSLASMEDIVDIYLALELLGALQSENA